MDLYVVDLNSTDIVLGVQRLKQLGLVVTNYTTLIMCFSRVGQQVHLHVDILIRPINFSGQQLRSLAHTYNISAIFQLSILLKPAQPTLSSSLAPAHLSSLKWNHLLYCFDHLFQEPTELPQPHSISYQIHLLPQSNPVNVCPYRYPCSQKAELEKQVATMLEASLILLSQSPFSSPILLVKKKNGS